MREIGDSLLLNTGIKPIIVKGNHPSFIEGRVADISIKDTNIGFIGEIHPQILENWGLEIPVTILELNLLNIYETTRSS